MNKFLGFIALTAAGVTIAAAHNSYTGGFSGSPGTNSCASSCHGGATGTMHVDGFPTTYTPGQSYTITITHNGGNKFVNVNATTRLGTTSTIGGTFIAGSNSALYTGTDGGIYVTPHLVDAVVFQWKAPAAKSGPVRLYAAGYQATSTSSTSGQSAVVTATATELTTGVEPTTEIPHEFALSPNFPNPFNPQTTIRFTVPQTGIAVLKVYNIQGEEVATLFNGMAETGRILQTTFNAVNLPSGIYFSRLEFNGNKIVQKMLFTK